MASFPLRLPNIPLYANFLSPLLATCLTHLILLDTISRIILVAGCQWRRIWSCSFLSSSLSLLGPNVKLFTLESKDLGLLYLLPYFHLNLSRPNAGARTSSWWTTAWGLYCLVPYSVHSLLYHRPALRNFVRPSIRICFMFFSKPPYLQESENFMKWLALVSGKKSL